MKSDGLLIARKTAVRLVYSPALFSALLFLAVFLYASPSLADSSKDYASAVSALSSGYTPAASPLGDAVTGQIRAYVVDSPSFPQGTHNAGVSGDLTFANVSFSLWSYCFGGVIGSETRTASAESTAEYRVKQAGSYLLANHRVSDETLVGVLYSFSSRNVEHGSGGSEQQRLHTLGGVWGYHRDSWYFFNTLTCSAGFHSGRITTPSGGFAQTDYRSKNVKNSLVAGKIVDSGVVKIIPEVGLTYDYIGSDDYRDSSNNAYTGINKNTFHGSLGVRALGSTEIMGTSVEPYLALSLVKSIGSRDIVASRYDRLTGQTFSVTDELEHSYFVVDTGVTFNVDEMFDARYGYVGVFSPHVSSNSMQVGLSLRDWNMAIIISCNLERNQKESSPAESAFDLRLKISL